MRPAFTLSYIQKCKETLLNDLNRLTRCLEIYLDYYVVGVKIDKILPDIKELPSIDKVLSFNYTDTYARLYSLNPSLEIDYIHGKADINNTVEDNNMVLGIDEFL